MNPTQANRANFKPASENSNWAKLALRFNPVSLQYSVSNTLQEKDKTTQFVTKSSAKLTMDLIFDTTDTGQDVRQDTSKLARYMEPKDPKSPSAPAVVIFSWGSFSFKGIIEQFKETLDFFSDTGVPLRSSASITMSQQTTEFQKVSGGQAKTDVPVLTLGRQDVTDISTAGGDSSAGRSLAALNGLENMRFPGGASVAFGGDVALKGAVAFSAGASASAGIGATAGIGISGGIGASAGAGVSLGIGASAGAAAAAELGFGASAGATFGVSAGLSPGASTGVGFAASASAGASFAGASASFSTSTGGAVFGASASAGMSASQGAFSGLRMSSSSQTSVNLDVSRLLPLPQSVGIGTDQGATFGLGGVAVMQGSAGLSADVGTSATLRAGVRFDGT